MALDEKIYLDHAAGTPIDKDVLDQMLPYFGSDYGNSSSMHTSGRNAKNVIDKSRGKIAKIINASPSEIIFTGSGTESDNMAILGVARAYKSFGNHVLISSVEHKAVLESAFKLRKEGFVVEIIPTDKFGKVSVEEIAKLINENTILVSVMYANNEIGTIEPIRDIATVVRKYRGSRQFPLFHTDACQAAGYLSLDADELGVDLMTLNSSKIYGPKGAGVLFKRKCANIDPIVVGGEQEMSLRAGTENIALIYGMAEALQKACKEKDTESERLSGLRDYFIYNLRRKIPDMVLNGHPKDRLPNNIHISIPHVEGESMLLMLDEYGIEASTGSACSAFDLKPSHVLSAIDQSEEIMHGSVRFSLGRSTERKDIDRVLEIFPPIVKRLKKLSALTVKKI